MYPEHCWRLVSYKSLPWWSLWTINDQIIWGVGHGEFHGIFYGVTRQSLNSKVSFEQKPEGSEGPFIVESMLTV